MCFLRHIYILIGLSFTTIHCSYGRQLLNKNVFDNINIQIYKKLLTSNFQVI